MRHLRHVVGTALIAVLAFGGTSSAQETARHSGWIIAVDERAGTLDLAEVGPWRVRNAATLLIYRRITVTSETAFSLVGPSPDPPRGFPNDFIETEIMPWAVYTNDYVTVDCRHDGERLIALKIAVVDVPIP